MKRITLIALLFIVVTHLFGQGAIEKKKRLSDKVFFGGGLGLQFGSVTAIEVSPIVGYMPINNLRIGAKFTYQYYKISKIDYSTHIHGASLFTMYDVFRGALVYAEIESLSLESKIFDRYNNFPNQDRFWIHSPLVGVGYSQDLGGRARMIFLVLFNLNQTIYSPYTNPIVQVNFLF